MASELRHRSPYSRAEQIKRILWFLCQGTLFRWSPRPLWGFRIWMLQLFGAKIGRHVHVYNTTRIFCPWLLTIADHSAIGDGVIIYNLGPLTIGSHVTISQRAHLCGGTHDYRHQDMPLIRASIDVENDAWVCAEAFVGPHVTIGEGAIVGARGVVVRDVTAWTVVCGNPARFIKSRDRLGFHSSKDAAEELV